MNENNEKKTGIAESVKATAEFVGESFLAGFVLSAIFTAFGLGIHSAGFLGQKFRDKLEKK